MASTINSDNGVVSGSSGLKSTADTSGVLALQSNGTTGLTLNTSLALGVGSGNSTGSSGQVLTSTGSGAAPAWATVSTGNFGTDITATDYTLTTSSALSTVATNIQMQAVSLDGTSELMVFYGSSSIHAVVWNSGTNTFGTPVLVRTANLSIANNGSVALKSISSTSVLVCTIPNASTALETVVLSISGSTITVNTPLATTLAANSTMFQANTRLVTVGSSYVLNYYTTTGGTPKFRAITVSGTTPSIGAELAYTGPTVTAMHCSYAYSSSVLLYLGTDGGTLAYAYPITVSGTTLTGGTQATVTSNDNVVCSGVLSTGRVAFTYRTASGLVASLVSVSGSTATITPAATLLSVGGNTQMQVFSNQAIILAGTSATDQINVLTDTASTPTVGTALTPGFTCSIVGYLSTGKVFVQSNASGGLYHQYGISGGSPVLEKVFQQVGGSTVASNCYAYAAPLSGPPQSASGKSINVRTSAGKTSVGGTAQPFQFSFDGSNIAKLQQAANPLQAYNDAISEAVAWGVPQAISSTATSITVKRVTLV